MYQIDQDKGRDELDQIGAVRLSRLTQRALVLDNYHRLTGCPCCRSAAIYAKGRLHYDSPIRFSSLEINLKRIAELWGCRECGSWFVQHALPESTARDLYRLGESATRWGAQQIGREKTRAAISVFETLLFDGVRQLDIGCSTGELLDLASRRGAVTVGVEPSAACGVLLERNGHQWFPDLDDPGLDRFDVISAFDVIEHLYDVPGFFKRCYELLRPAGRLVLLTGDISSLGARWSGPRWWYLQFPEHVVFPSRKFVSRVPGFEIVFAVRTYAAIGYRYPWRNVLKGLAVGLWRGHYQGWPPPGPDHWMAVLRKK